MSTGILTNRGFHRNRRMTALAVIPVFALILIGAYYLVRGDASEAARAVDPQLTGQIADTRRRIKVMKTLVKETPTHMTALKELGDAYVEMGALQKAALSEEQSRRNYALAVEQYTKYLAMSPNDEDVTIYMSLAYLNMGESDRAIQIMEGLSRLAPDSQKTWYTFGWVYEKSGNEAGAEWAWTKGLKLDPDSAIAAKITEFLGSQDPVGPAPGTSPHQ